MKRSKTEPIHRKAIQYKFAKIKHRRKLHDETRLDKNLTLHITVNLGASSKLSTECTYRVVQEYSSADPSSMM